MIRFKIIRRIDKYGKIDAKTSLKTYKSSLSYPDTRDYAMLRF